MFAKTIGEAYAAPIIPETKIKTVVILVSISSSSSKPVRSLRACDA